MLMAIMKVMCTKNTTVSALVSCPNIAGKWLDSRSVNQFVEYSIVR